MSKINADWHRKHRMPKNATLGERVEWHLARGRACGCRDTAPSHDSHRRGQIALALKPSGMKLPESVAIKGLWYEWYFGEPSRPPARPRARDARR
jgi:hypothetical protein